MKKVLLTSILCASIASATTVATHFTEAGTMEAGGRVSFHSYDQNNGGDQRENEFILEPIFNVYIVNQLYAAAKLHFRTQNKHGFFGLGGGIGYAFLPKAPIVPYVEGGAEFIYSGWLEKGGLALPISGGIKIPVYEHAIIDLNLGLFPKFINSNPGADFGFAAGVTIPIN